MQSLPAAVTSSRGFGEIELPTAGDSRSAIPVQAPPGRPAQGSFGEIDLPREPPSSVPPLRAAHSATPPWRRRVTGVG